jgi:hypothetical protein
MVTKIYLIISLFLLVSCGSNNTDVPISEDDSAIDFYNWQANLNDTNGKLEMKRVLTGSIDSMSPQSVLTYINTENPKIKLEYLRSSGDTVFLKIQDAAILTQQMGSAGASMYIAGIVYNLTELSGINYVNLDFKEGDHAQPGTYNRANFKNE